MILLRRLAYRANRLRFSLTKPITVGARIILVEGETILLVRHTYQREWYLPGGGVKKGETLEQAIRREAAEEIGATLGDLQFFGVYTNFYEGKSDHVIVFACNTFTLTGQTDAGEIERFDCFPLDDLPDNVSPGTQRRIREYVQRNTTNFGIW